jgi:hypothetical protein
MMPMPLTDMPAGPPAERTPRVLVLDDDPDLVVLVARVLTREGFHVTTAATFAEAVAYRFPISRGRRSRPLCMPAGSTFPSACSPGREASCWRCA